MLKDQGKFLVFVSHATCRGGGTNVTFPVASTLSFCV